MGSTTLRADLSRLRRVYAAALRGDKSLRVSAVPGRFSEHAGRLGWLRDRLAAGAAEAMVGQALFDALPFPAVILDEQLESGLSNCAWKADGASRALIRRAAGAVRRGRGHELSEVIRARTRRFLPVSATGLGRPTLVIPLVSVGPAAGASALVVIGSTQTPGSTAFAASARLLFGLTPAESAVAEGALAGKSLAEVAASRGTTLQTARYQMKNVLLKTGASTRTRLTQLLLQSLWQPGTTD